MLGIRLATRSVGRWILRSSRTSWGWLDWREGRYLSQNGRPRRRFAAPTMLFNMQITAAPVTMPVFDRRFFFCRIQQAPHIDDMRETAANQATARECTHSVPLPMS